MRPVPNVLRAAITVNKNTIRIEPFYIDHIMRQLREQLCEEIAHVRLSQQEDAFSITFRADCVVLSPDDFWRIVQEEAIRMGYHLGDKE